MDLQLASPLALLFLLVVPLLFLRHRRLMRRQAGLSFSSLGVATHLPRTFRLQTTWLPDFLRLLALTLIILAVARPQAGRAGNDNTNEGIDIVLALDVSYSMTERDMTGQSRLDAARQIATEF